MRGGVVRVLLDVALVLPLRHIDRREDRAEPRQRVGLVSAHLLVRATQPLRDGAEAHSGLTREAVAEGHDLALDGGELAERGPGGLSVEDGGGGVCHRPRAILPALLCVASAATHGPQLLLGCDPRGLATREVGPRRERGASVGVVGASGGDEGELRLCEEVVHGDEGPGKRAGDPNGQPVVTPEEGVGGVAVPLPHAEAEGGVRVGLDPLEGGGGHRRS